MSQIPPPRGSPQPRVPGPTLAPELGVKRRPMSSLLTFHKKQQEGLHFSKRAFPSPPGVVWRGEPFPTQLLLLITQVHCCPSLLKKTCFTAGFAEVLSSACLLARRAGALEHQYCHRDFRCTCLWLPAHTFTSPNWPRTIWCPWLSPRAWSFQLSVSMSH